MANGNNPHKDEYKWPWSVTDREFGALEQELKELRHDFRNLRAIVELSGISTVSKEEIIDNREDITKFKQHMKSSGLSSDSQDVLIKKFTEELTRLKIKVYTAFSVIGILTGIIVWLIDVAFRVIDKV